MTLPILLDGKSFFVAYQHIRSLNRKISGIYERAESGNMIMMKFQLNVL